MQRSAFIKNRLSRGFLLPLVVILMVCGSKRNAVTESTGSIDTSVTAVNRVDVNATADAAINGFNSTLLLLPVRHSIIKRH